ncbi:Telomeric repeat-binding factor 2-interacting protein 1 [Phytophthora nicotianae]|uniref:Telomeric repeat-binding factor 2-interacting protein 1 n=1 Tax=Phytophthora nicotianae TaxID=4792 RepID=A0A0W8CJT6_PHYNI|nr:Telomeric repeat-binding factor 2-interacting protein 1 [Phytophthora nicotianae]
MAPSENASLFHGLKFFLTRTLSRDDVAELQRLIELHGGIVSSSPAGATELVDYDRLDSRRPEWVSFDFIKDSVVSKRLQNPAKYSGVVFSSKPIQLHIKGRVRYSVEDDARLLLFAKSRGWQSLKPMPASAWKVAENQHVTNHTWQSMHEHFKKQLQNKTLKEQRAIMANASEIIRARLQQQEDQKEREQATRTSPSTTAPESPKPTTPAFKGSKGPKGPKGSKGPDRGAPSTPATSSPLRRQIREKARQKRKRTSSPVNVEEGKDNEGHGDITSGAVYFRSVSAEMTADPSKLQALFHTSTMEGSRRRQENNSESAASDSRESEEPEILAQDSSNIRTEQQTSEVDVQRATETETDEIICRLQLETNQPTPVVVHTLYSCSGDAGMARAFLKGASPSGMSSPEDDLLLVNLIVDENIDRSAVDAAVARGDFASMQVPRDTSAILDRVQFLR